MPIRIADLTAHDAQSWLPDALSVYVTAMNYPLGTEVQRAPLWHEHIQRPGWQAVGAFDSLGPASGRETLVGIAYGYSGANDQWWNQQVRSGLVRAGSSRERVSAITDSYFELTELHVHPSAQGQQIGEAILTRLLDGRDEPQVLLSTPEVDAENNRAWRLYRRLGFADVLRGFSFAGDPRPFAVLGRALPLR
ncbi:N-acetyltransferase [Nocardia sp. 348MFTsu5.1]|uniref:GNAT family N-acetyltransferase n=1 Tax=Nocardia sp. 348MFTsu5.1 TaxID=1172185 RepID=UPI000378D21D|nr:N-acetyltransferase [Nocardia sp. 348MFTsu5.1]